MSPGRYWISVIILLLLVFAFSQYPVVSSFRERDSSSLPPTEPQPAMAILSVPANNSIVVNGALAITGATILSGATIETSNQTLATVEFGSFGLLTISPNTTLKPEFAQDNKVKVTISQGCMILRTGKGITGEVVTPQGPAARTDPNATGSLPVCFPQRAWPPPGKENGRDGLFHIIGAAMFGVIGGHTEPGLGIGLTDRGMNPGPSAP